MSRVGYNHVVIEITRKLADQNGFHVLPRCWKIWKIKVSLLR